tara:strand:- start:1728 stop:2468 length:741 start_codon:yes stop_codon:yes gene_type:complete
LRVSFTYLVPSLLAVILHATVLGLVIANWSEAAPTQPFGDELFYIKANLVSENPHKQKEIQEGRSIKVEQAAHELTSFDVPTHSREPDTPIAVKDTYQMDRRKDFLPLNSETAGEEVLDPVTKRLIKLEKPLMILGFKEENGRMAVTDNEKTQAYISQIQRDIVQNWSRPPSARNGMQVQLRVFLVPTGEVIEVILEKRSGNAAFDRSAVLAVTKAERFLVPSDSRKFEKNFREFTILFRPEDLRL